MDTYPDYQFNMERIINLLTLVLIVLFLPVFCLAQEKEKESKNLSSKDIVIYPMGRAEGPVPDWAIGPFEIGKVKGQPMIFRPHLHWKDEGAPDGWAPAKFWNPTLMEKDGKIYLFYRTGPKLEGLQSRIGVAWSEDGVQWHDYENNPIIFPTENNEKLGCEDPRIYKYGDTYFMYYNAVWDLKDMDKSIPRVWDHNDGEIGVDICLAISTDLIHWEKKGIVVPRSVSKGWAKAAVIPRSPEGEAVKINGQFIMYISERLHSGKEDVKEQMIGYSKDLIHWEFEQKPYLEPDENIKSIYEVATAVTNFPGSDNIVMDIYYVQGDGVRGCAQALYSKKDPFKRIDFTTFGLCSWGGFIFYDDQWLFAQGWVEPEAIYLYKAPVVMPWIKVENIVLDKKVVNPGQVLKTSVTLKNIGKTEGTRTISIYVNGEIFSDKEVSVEAGKSIKVDFKITRERPGIYQLMVDNQSVCFEVTAPNNN